MNSEKDNILMDDNKKIKKCLIDDTDKILTCEYNTIIILTTNKHLYKIFPVFYSSITTDKHNNIKTLNNAIKCEIKMIKLITRDIINKNISKHFVKYISSNNCKNANLLFAKCSASYIEYIKLEEEQQLDSMYFNNYLNRELQNEYKIMEIEYCNYSCTEFIKDISMLSITEIEIYLDIFFFQIIHSLESIKKIYPYFQHNNLYMQNILGLKEKDNSNYYTYKYNNKIFYVPQKKFFPKINDFGESNLNDKYKSYNLFKSDYRDLYGIMMQIYKYGDESFTTLCSNDENKLEFFKIYFSNFFNVDIVDELFNKNNSMMRYEDMIKDIEFVNYIEFKSPDDLLNNYFYNIYDKINKEII